ncbi:MAG: trypsin-like serine protease [Nannocystaceae bacterium]
MTLDHRRGVSLAASLALGAVACSVEVLPRTANDGVDRIVNGEDTAIEELPWQVLVSGWCGGSIVNRDWVLTAAHCVTDEDASLEDLGDLWIKAGVTDRTAAGQVRHVSEVHVAPGWDGIAWHGADAALLRLDEPLDFSDAGVHCITLANAEDDEAYAGPGEPAVTSGWGSLSEDGGSTDILQSVTLSLVSFEDAQEYYGSLTDDHIATATEGFDSCYGDSGGPLTVDADGQTLQVGIVSWGQGCASGAPGMYARVSSFVDWIAEVTGEDAGTLCESSGDPGADPTNAEDDAGTGDGPKGSCEGSCGVEADGCWCDDECVMYDDCCEDVGLWCG